MLFNKPSNMSYREWFISDARSLLNLMPKVVKWVYEEDMADKEKTAYPTSKTTGGYLRMCDPYEKRQKWWDELSNRDKQKIRDIPNFDADIFYECTGIRV